MKRAVSIIVICAILIACGCIYYVGNFQQRKSGRIDSASKAVAEYMAEKGIKEEDYQLKIDYRLDSKLLGYSGYVIEVVYKDEPNVTYNYDYMNGGIIPKSAGDRNNSEYKAFKHQ